MGQPAYNACGQIIDADLTRIGKTPVFECDEVSANRRVASIQTWCDCGGVLDGIVDPDTVSKIGNLSEWDQAAEDVREQVNRIAWHHLLGVGGEVEVVNC